jgi:hypothetical protein
VLNIVRKKREKIPKKNIKKKRKKKSIAYACQEFSARPGKNNPVTGKEI